MTSPGTRSVAVRLSMEPTPYIAGAARAEAATLSLDRAVSKVGPSSATSMERAAKSAEKTGTSFLSLNSITGRLGIGVGALAGLTGAAVVKMAGDYQQSVTKLATTAGESTKNLHMVSQGMLDMAGEVGVSAQELAKGMYTVESSGMHGADALLVLKAAAQGARQEQADLAHVTDAVTTSLHDYHLPASQAATVTSQLIAAVSRGKTTFDELTGAMHSVEPIAASAGMSIAQTAGALAAMTASGMHADQAAQNLASSIRSFEKPTGTMRDELYQLGLDANDLSAHLGQRGIAGTLQLVSDAIVQKMGPAGQVALDSLNKNKAAAQDLVIMMKSMTPEVAKLSSGLLDGSVSVSEYTKAAKGLGGQQAAMAIQFLSLYKSSAGFSQILKSGGPAVQTYLGALGKGVGTAEGLSVALQLTGENADATNKTIAAVGKAAADTKGDIAGWGEVQANFNQQLAQTVEGAKSLAIEAGQHLLPVLTAGLTWINDHGNGALHDLGVGFHDVGEALQPVVTVGEGALHFFQSLPGPVKDAVLALGALKIASSFDLFGRFGSNGGATGGLRSAGQSLVGFAQTVRTQMALADSSIGTVSKTAGAMGTAFETYMPRSTAALHNFSGEVSSAYTNAKKLQQFNVAQAFGGDAVSKATGDLAGLGAAAKATASGGLSLMKSAGAGVMGLFGGPWGLALTGAAIGVGLLTDSIQKHDAAVTADTAKVQKWQEALHFGTADAAKAQEGLAGMRAEFDKNQAAIDRYNAAAAQGGARGGIGTLIERNKELKKELDGGTAAWQKQLSEMTPVQEGQERVAAAEYKLGMAMKSGSPDAIAGATAELTTARGFLTSETDKANKAEETQAERLQKSANAALAAADADLALKLGQLQLSDAVTSYNKGIADGTLKGNALTEAQLQLEMQARQVAQAAADAAVAQAKQNGATETGTTATAAYKQSLLDSAKTMSGPARDALIAQAKNLDKSTTSSAIATEAMKNLGLTVNDLPPGHFIKIDAPTQKQLDDLHHLGYVTVTLPDGHVVVTADTHPAQTAIQELLQYARTQAILYRATLPSLVDNKVTSGSGRSGLATGGWVRGPGTGTSDDVPLMGSNGEFMVKAASAGMYGHTAMDAVNQGRAKIIVPALANGGWVGPPGNGSTVRIPVRIDPSSVSAVDAAMHAKLAAAAARATLSPPGTGVERLRPVVDNVLRMLGQPISYDNGVLAMIRSESGGQSTIVNRTDSNWAAGHPSVGDMQVIAGTFARFAGPYRNTGPFSYGVSTNDTANIYAGTNYALQEYGPGILASGGRHSASGHYVGYKGGTPFVPEDGLAFVHRGERVVTAEANAAPRTREFFTGNGGGGTQVVQHTDARSYPLSVQTGPGVAEIVRAVTDKRHDDEFLHG